MKPLMNEGFESLVGSMTDVPSGWFSNSAFASEYDRRVLASRAGTPFDLDDVLTCNGVGLE